MGSVVVTGGADVVGGGGIVVVSGIVVVGVDVVGIGLAKTTSVVCINFSTTNRVSLDVVIPTPTEVKSGSTIFS